MADNIDYFPLPVDLQEQDEDAVITSEQFARAFYDNQYEQHQNPNAHKGIDVGMREIRKYLGGIGRSWLVYVGGPEKAGKTTTMLAWMLYAAQHHKIDQARLAVDPTARRYRMLWAGQEMSVDDMAAKVFAYFANPATGVEYAKFRDISLTAADWPEMQRIRDLVSTLDVYWTTHLNYLEDLLDKAEQLNVDILFGDYFQLFSSKAHRKDPGSPQELRYMSKLLRRWTMPRTGRKQGRTAIFAAQNNREGNKGKFFSSANYFAGTAGIEQDASVAMTVSPMLDSQGNEVPNRRLVQVVASRHSEKFKFEVEFIGARSRIEDIEEVTVDINELANTRMAAPGYQAQPLPLKQTATAAPDPLDRLVDTRDYGDEETF